jgi:glycosyltransferase involved in cell wall biosynthesis
MHIGEIGYAAQTGNGIMTEDLVQHLGAKKQLVIPHHEAKPLPMVAPREAIYAKAWSPSRTEIEEFCEGIDIAITVETDWGPNASLQWPIDLDRIPHKKVCGPAKTFVHNGGNIGIKGRKGTSETIRAFNRTISRKPDIRLIINTQRSLTSAKDMDLVARDYRITHRVHNPTDFADLYKEGDVLIYCSKMDGQSLIGAEGCAAGFPVITTSAPPMNEYWTGFYGIHDDRLLVNVKRTEPAHSTNPESVLNLVDLDDFAEKIIWCSENDMEPISVTNRYLAENFLSWDKWKDSYFITLEALMNNEFSRDKIPSRETQL